MRKQSPRRLSGGQHNRGGNMEGSLREHRDEDLALFQDMRSQERHNFLHPSNDDIEASFSTKFEGFNRYRPPSSTPSRKINNDLLAMDSEKNEYDWLLTPPGTPLFPSLDQDTIAIHDSRIVLSQAQSASRLAGSSMRHSHCSVPHGSPSPRRPSTALSTSSSNSSARGRTPSPSRKSSSPTHRPSTPSRALGRTSSSMQRPSARSTTPTLRKVSPSSVGRASSTERTRSLSGQNRGRSLRLQAWQTPGLGFLEETPPNLRTSILDHPQSVARSASSGFRHCDSRHSYSEQADITHSRLRNTPSFGSRSSNSSISQDRYSSKGSVVSSSDDGVEITQAAYIDSIIASPNGLVSDEKMFARSDNQARNRTLSSRKQQIRATNVETSVRKSLESSMQQVDHRHNPPTMFRPLLSCAPASSFYNGGYSIVHHTPGSPSVEHSITASSNASSEQGVRIVPGGESSDEEDRVNESEWDDKNLLSEVAASKTGADEDEVTNPEYMDIILSRYARYGHKEHFRQGSDDISSPFDANDVSGDNRFKINKDGVNNTSDWTQKEVLLERTWNSSEAGDHVNGNLTIQVHNDEFEYASVDDGSIGLDSQRDATISPCGDANVDQLFVDIQQDVSAQSSCINLDGHFHSNLQGESSLGDDKPESETLQTSQMCRQPRMLDEEATHTAECESVIWCPQGQGGLLPPKDFKHDSRGKHALSTDSDTGEIAVHDRQKGLTGKVSPGQDKDGENLTLLLADSTSTATLSKTRNVVKTDRSVSSISNVGSESSLTAEKVDGLQLDAFPSQGDSTAHFSADSSLYCDNLSVMHNLMCSETGPVDNMSFRVESDTITNSTEEKNEDSCNGSGLQLENDYGKVTSRSCKKESQCDIVTVESCEYHRDTTKTFEDFKSYGTTGPSSSPRQCVLADFDNASSSDGFGQSGQASPIEGAESEYLDKVLSLDGSKEAILQAEEECSNHAINIADSEALPVVVDCMQQDVAAVPLFRMCKTSMNEADQSALSNACERATQGAFGSVLETPDLHTEESLEMEAPIECSSQLPLFSPDQNIPSADGSQKLDSSKSDQCLAQSAQAILMPGTSPDQPSNLGEDTMYEIQDNTTAHTATDVFCEQIEEQSVQIDSQHESRESIKRNTVTQNFNLEEATNTILFCSSIVHDIVYRAATTAAEKEKSFSQAQPYSAGILMKHEFSRASYSKCHIGRVQKSGNWKDLPRDTLLAVHRSLSNNYNKEEVADEIPTITVHPAVVDGMRRDGMDEGKALSDVTRIKDEKGPARFTVNTNCQCTVM